MRADIVAFMASYARASSGVCHVRCRFIFRLILLGCIAISQVNGQVSLTSAVDRALENSPKILSAEHDVNRAKAALAVTKDIFIPSVVTGGGVGDAYGITLSVPTIFTINAQSLVYSAQQRFYIRAARSDLQAASLALQEARGQIEEDTVLTYLSLDHAQKTAEVVAEQYALALKLVSIVEDRVNAKLENDLELIKSQRVAVQLKLQKIRAENDEMVLREHLAHLTGLPEGGIRAQAETIPAMPSLDKPEEFRESSLPESAGILSAQANVEAKRQRADGDSRYTWRPQVTFGAQYGRVSPIENVSEFYNLHNNYNSASAGVQIQFPLLDRVRKAAAKQSTEDALRSETDLDGMRAGEAEDRLKLQRSIPELATIQELAQLELKIAQSELSSAELQAKQSSGGPLVTPKDEVNARIQERQRYLDLIDANLQLERAKVSLVRQKGELDKWVHSPEGTGAPTAPLAP